MTSPTPLLPTRLNRPDRLTRRELDVISLVADGHSYKETAYLLGISNRTVEHYSERIKFKTGTQTLADLVKWAIREGLTKA